MMTPQDLAREVRTVFALADAGDETARFCAAGHGMFECDRHVGHHGKHAHAFGAVVNPATGFWEFTRVAQWKVGA